MESAAPSSFETQHSVAEAPHDAGHGDEFYELTNPKYFGLPLGVLIAASVSVISICITLVKFFGTPL